MITYNGTAQVVIDAPGDYTIDRDLTQPDPSQSCVVILPGVHYVTLRLRSRLVGAGGPNSVNAGIDAAHSAAVTILGDGGSIRGFAWGARMADCYLARVRGLFVQDSLFRGIVITGDNAMVSECDIRNITGAMWTQNAYCMGIEVSGMSVNGKPSILRNHVANVVGMGEGESVGISITDKGVGAVVAHNVIANHAWKDKSFGLWVGGDSDATVASNVFDNWRYGLAFSSPPVGWVDENAYRRCTSNILDSGGDVLRGSSDLSD